MFDRVATLLIAVIYPVAVFVTLKFFSITELGYVTLIIGAVRFLLTLSPKKPHMRFDKLGGLLIAIGVIILWSESASTARLYPVIVNLGMLAYFGWSWLHPPSAIERIARISEPDLPPHAVIYTARVTLVWCLFFVVNGTIAFYTAFWSSLEIWTLYNGLIAYLAMGLLFSVEYLIRRRVRKATDV
ncbi:MAG: hypothetical protein O7G86_12090 [Gammaproteobacteria bacterium]|nr:hypothetical protein [Gammaproteobacteria bacterium]